MDAESVAQIQPRVCFETLGLPNALKDLRNSEEGVATAAIRTVDATLFRVAS